MNTDHRLLPSDWREEWTREIAMPLDEAAAVDVMAVLVFQLDAEWFSLPVATVLEITTDTPRHHMPHRASGVAIVNVRGRVTPCVDLGTLLHPVEHASDGGRDWLVVFQDGGWTFASGVDAVHGVHRLELRAVQPPPPPPVAGTFTTGMWDLAGRTVAQLDHQRLFATAREALA
jgi:chemotaxis signal transduction protein